MTFGADAVSAEHPAADRHLALQMQHGSVRSSDVVVHREAAWGVVDDANLSAGALERLTRAELGRPRREADRSVRQDLDVRVRLLVGQQGDADDARTGGVARMPSPCRLVRTRADNAAG